MDNRIWESQITESKIQTLVIFSESKKRDGEEVTEQSEPVLNEADINGALPVEEDDSVEDPNVEIEVCINLFTYDLYMSYFFIGEPKNEVNLLL